MIHGLAGFRNCTGGRAGRADDCQVRSPHNGESLGRLFGSLVVTLALLGSGCTAFHRETSGQWVPSESLAKDPSVVILPIADVVEKGEGPVGGSGAEFTSAIRDDLLAHGVKVTMADSGSLRDGLETASSLDFLYVLKGAITQWEDNATEWSGNPDRAALTLELYGVSSKQLVASAGHKMNGSSGAFISLSPHRFVPEIVSHSLARLFGWRPKVWYK